MILGGSSGSLRLARNLWVTPHLPICGGEKDRDANRADNEKGMGVLSIDCVLGRIV